MRKKIATIYVRRGAWLGHANATTKDGLLILCQPVIKLDLNASDEAVGAMVRRLLDGARFGVSHPKTFAHLFDPMLELAGVKSWSTFAKSAKSVSVTEDVGQVLIQPSRNLGGSRGFEDTGEPLATTEDDVGALLRQAISLCG